MKLCKDASVDEYTAWEYFSTIRDLYSQTWRKYHNLSHIYRYIKSVVNHKDKLSDINSILFSVWFHDVIYTPSRNDNEERSVELFKQFVKDANLKIDIDKVCKYIICTKYHFTNTEYDDSDLNYFLDFDLETFSIENFDDYSEINSGIRYEYTHHFKLEEFIQGRLKFLQLVLSKNSIFRTEEFRNNSEKKARDNIQREINFYS